MKIKYVVSRNENSQGSIRELERKEFSGVDLAIAYHRAQRNGSFSWWEITVEYEPEQ